MAENEWNIKICVEHIVALKSPFENMGNGKMAQLGQKLVESAKNLRLPKLGG